MDYAKIPEKEAVLIVRILGLLINQAGIYGPLHNVTRTATRSVFSEVEQTVKTHGTVEVVLKGDKLLVNGSSAGLDGATGKNLSERMLLHKIGGLLFLAPLDRDEFTVCVTLFGTAPQVLLAEGGFAAALNKKALRSVRAVTVAYQRVAEDSPAPPPAPATKEPSEAMAAAVQRRPPAVPDRGVLDLSAAFGGDGAAREAEEEGVAARAAAGGEAEGRRQRKQRLADLLRETAAVLEGGSAQTEESQQRQVLEALRNIRAALSESTAQSERQIASLANQVDEDRQTIASIESAARRRGIGLKLTRSELVERYAELNQEIMQPLTVSTGVLDLLRSGQAGDLTASQRDLLRMAEESVERVNQLVAYMNRISGLPETYTPDASVIADTYR